MSDIQTFQSFQAVVAKTLIALSLVHIVVLGLVAWALGRTPMYTPSRPTRTKLCSSKKLNSLQLSKAGCGGN